ncbi:hypothetical protein C7447_10934 [Tenacibaculum adriaticum]|uniref:Uncharacterized protein n=1 Tax=Tenacibaculum adriaticum TaxID=413713 RepID=A0A5S5DJM5_9FLAO|nr:hypothetical protein [Tenacibaculum adriaticum]TYP96097.1 hypothetical protein C7447_10934 [Tenacibaculum adriaticum]
MPKDIRDIVKGYEDKNAQLSSNHQLKFQQKLNTEFKPKKSSFSWLYIAASIVVLIGLGITFYPKKNIGVSVDDELKTIKLGNVSPELKTIEAYYTNSINYEISQLPFTDENKELIEGYLLKIGELTKEYKTLTEELNKEVNDETIDALINNLQLRLQLLKRLKDQLNSIKNSKQNENTIV